MLKQLPNDPKANYSRFCPHCGSKMASFMQICPECGKRNTAPAAVVKTQWYKSLSAIILVGGFILIGIGSAAVFYHRSTTRQDKPMQAPSPSTIIAQNPVAPTEPAQVSPAPRISSYSTPTKQQSDLTQEEQQDIIQYCKHYTKITSMVNDATNTLKGFREDRSKINLSESEIQSAWQLQLNYFNVPDSFVLANNYLSNGLTEAMSAMHCLSLIEPGFDSTETIKDANIHFKASVELFNKSSEEYQSNLEGIRKSLQGSSQ